jgi:hypothetical protein
MHHAHLQTQAINPQEYNIDTAKVILQMINKMNMQFAQTYSLAKGIKAFGADVHQAAHEKMQQVHDCVVFIPLLVEELTPIERKRAMESLIFLTEKKDGTIKAKTCANGRTQREYTNCNKAASPTAMTESHMITAVLNAKQDCDILPANIPNALVQTEIEEKDIRKRTIMKIRGQLINMLVDIAPEEYQNFV